MDGQIIPAIELLTVNINQGRPLLRGRHRPDLLLQLVLNYTSKMVLHLLKR